MAHTAPNLLEGGITVAKALNRVHRRRMEGS